MRYNKFFIIALSFIIAFSSVLSVSASEYEPEIFVTQTYALEEPEKDMQISTTSATYIVRSVFNSSVDTQSGNLVYGATVTAVQNSANNFIPEVQITLRNGNGVLFSEPGDITLRMVARCYQLIVTCSHRDGSTSTYTPDPSTFDNYQVDLKIQNYDADIYAINIIFRASPSNSDNDYLSCSVQYGYKFNQGDVFHVITRFFKSFFTNTFSTIGNVLTDFFGSLKNVNLFGSSVHDLDTTQDDLVQQVGSVNDIVLSEIIFENFSVLSTFAWLSTIFMKLYAEIPFSVIFEITCTLLIVATVLGFSRKWVGNGHSVNSSPDKRG